MRKILFTILILEFINLLTYNSIIINTAVSALAVIYLILFIVKMRKEGFRISYILNFLLLLLALTPFEKFVDKPFYQFIDIIVIYGIIYIFVFPNIYHKALENHRLFGFVVILVVYIVTFGTISFYILEGASLMDSFWYSCVTVTSVGYGDFVPVTVLGKIAGIIEMFGGLVIIAFLTTYIIELFKKSIKKSNLNDDEKLNILKKQKLKIEQEIAKIEKK